MGGIKKRRKNDGLFYIAIECRIGYRRTYGIAAIDREDSEKIILDAVVDVAENREKVEQLADRLNKEKVQLERFREAIEDIVDIESTAVDLG